MRVYTLELTETELACGVTLDQVADVMPRVLVRDGRLFLPANTPPALGKAVARCVFADEPHSFIGITLGMPVYRLT